MLKQDARPLRISSHPRSSLNSSHHGSIDAVLKDLKNCSRRLHVALDAFRNEYHLLERLYYKGKNQHRLALFWRRVVEIRRFCRRLDGLHVDQIADTLRSSFFAAEAAPSNSKMMRGSWTHIPELAPVDLASQRCSACCALLEKMQEKLLDSYRSFNLAMQSGAFLQLILTLAAIASRMRAVGEELQEVLQATQDIARRISGILSAPTNNLAPLITDAVENEATTHPHHPQEFLTPQSGIAESSGLDLMTTSVQTGPTRRIVERSAAATADALKLQTAAKVSEHSRKKKRPKPRDEIDDIFGF
ncbi:putative protein with domain of unknown function (DUF4477) [Lyophyllum shimeji]|uniref:Nucleolus and neural progenitor protein-like N-terminal domain-containing protein n=1 Tax=Lyophyllum shimeji TaxID=47721 RepID=A0A9P3PGG4_LYOSH|nr:putative protein with domain of unknown function (DUF4477) [Lyophyllum shimeji]